MGAENRYADKASEKAKMLVAAIKEKTALDAYKINIAENSKPDILDSKFGGVPYWDMAKEYPLDSMQKKMMLLAQINFSQAALNDERLPKQGMLQFFIAAEDDVFGADFEVPDSQKYFRIVYHENINENVTCEQVRALDIPIATDENNEYSPVFKEAKVKICKTISYMGPEVFGFDDMFRQVVKEQTGEEIGNMSAYNYLNDDDHSYLYDELCNTGHWLLGYPYFTQYDPRENMDAENANYYNMVLFQMDSDMKGREDYVLWGDCGVANFFINSEALKNKDFSRVMYNWDCC